MQQKLIAQIHKGCISSFQRHMERNRRNCACGKFGMALQHIASQKIEWNPWMSKMEGQIQHPQMLGKPSPFQSKESFLLWIVSTVITLLSHSFLRNQQTPWKTSDNFTSRKAPTQAATYQVHSWPAGNNKNAPGIQKKKKKHLADLPKTKKVSPSLQTKRHFGPEKKGGNQRWCQGFRPQSVAQQNEIPGKNLDVKFQSSNATTVTLWYFLT